MPAQHCLTDAGNVIGVVASIWASVKQWHDRYQMCHCLNDAGVDLILLLPPAGIGQAVLHWASAKSTPDPIAVAVPHATRFKSFASDN